jgi:hypothetical protein
MEKSEVKKIVKDEIKKRLNDQSEENHLTVYFNNETDCQEVKDMYSKLNFEVTPDKKGLLIPIEHLIKFL